MRYHKKRHNFADISSEICECGAGPEDASHYLFFCSNFHAQRAQLMNQVIPLLRNYNLMQHIHSPCLFLYGDKSISDSDNKTIISSTIEYILESEKFGTYPPTLPLPFSRKRVSENQCVPSRRSRCILLILTHGARLSQRYTLSFSTV